ncbi:MAG: CDP-archaeol synthase [Desulfobulbaceae bacterium]|uniref:CDP-archaeol synthase n=1 Tax=Candidatus Desulfatifera sulfidica TaxID=2841691 RepID=A0A8J6T900_9BACT|nr:CDP-archaeol synthase [Candidatus Desulfatifera sulfidica]
MQTIISVLLFLLWLNLMPPLAGLIFGKRGNFPVDCHHTWIDGRPLFGANKTMRGILASLAGGAMAGPLIGLHWQEGIIVAALAMTGDLISSFCKRRFKRKSGEGVFFLDQVFEGLLPLLFLKAILGFSITLMLDSLLIFVALAYVSSRFWHYVLFRPSPQDYPKTVRSTVRLREWRACHVPLTRWKTLLNLSSFLSNRFLFTWIFTLAGLYDRGISNALNVQVKHHHLNFTNLPPGFAGFRILLLTDLHLDGLDTLTENIIDKINGLDYDLCLMGGDLRMELFGPAAPCLRQLRKLIPALKCPYGVLGVLGNHDCIEMIPDLEEVGITMLVNDFWEIKKNGESIWIVGVDDPHYYKMANAEEAYKHIPEGAFSIFLAHSPEAYDEAATHGATLYLCGHTHGGQICLPDKQPLITNSRAPRRTAAGLWQHRDMTGITSRGTGTSSIPLRFNCPGEILLITLHQPASSTNREHHNTPAEPDGHRQEIVPV